MKKYNLNEKFFDKWSNDMAWVLGYLYTDGNLYKSKIHNRISFYQKEEYVVDKIRNLLGSTHPIKSSITLLNGKKYKNYRITIDNKYMYASLIRKGLSPKKSLTIKMPQIPSKYLSHFIRGIFDGDGGIVLQKNRNRAIINYTTFSKHFAIKLNIILRPLLLSERKKIYKEYNVKTGNINYHFTISGKNDVLIFYNFIYKNCNASFLIRKKVIMEQYLQNKNLLMINKKDNPWETRRIK